MSALLVLVACVGPPATEPASRVDAPPHVPPDAAAAAPATEAAAQGATLRGRVMKDGRPVVGMVVALLPPPPPRSGSYEYRAIATAVAGDDGRYEFAQPVAPGQYLLELQDHRPRQPFGSWPGHVVRRPLVVVAGQALPPIDFVLR